MAAKQKVFGPYRVKNIGAGGDVYEVVEMVDNTSNTWQELRPRKTYLKRQSAYAKCVRLNRHWQDDIAMSDVVDIDGMFKYWREATN